MTAPNKELLTLVNEAIDVIDDPEVLKHLAKRCWDQARYHATSQINYGSLVEFTNKNGRVVCGVVFKINEKSVKVREQRGGNVPRDWTVSPTLLRPVPVVLKHDEI